MDTNNYSQNNKQNLSIFWVEVDKIKPNPMQPRHEFDEAKLQSLADSIKQYGLLQPIVVVRNEREIPTGTEVDYELIAGERRLRASKLAGLARIPVIIRQEDAEKVKLELALIENVQREDLNAIERAKAFKQLIDNFKMKQREVAASIGKSREFVANSLRLLSLPPEFQEALINGQINEGHTRPLLMLTDKPEAQQILFKDIIYKKMSVRDAEKVSRRIAYERARRHDEMPDQRTREMEESLASTLGTRVTIERKGLGGVVSISFFSDEELEEILGVVAKKKADAKQEDITVSQKNIISNEQTTEENIQEQDLNTQEVVSPELDVETSQSDLHKNNPASLEDANPEEGREQKSVSQDAIDNFSI